MGSLSHRDFQTLLSALADLNADISRATLPQRTTAAISKIIPNEIVSFDGFDAENKYSFTAWNNGEGLLTPELLEIFAQFAYQHPLIPVALEKNPYKTVSTTDYISQLDFEKTDLYNEFFRHLGHKYQLGAALPITGGLTISCGMNRADKDFSGRDKLMMALAAPHLSNTIRQAFAFERLNNALETHGVVIVRANGKTQFVSELAGRLLEKYFANHKREADFLPAALKDWIKQNNLSAENYDLPPQPLKIENAEGELTIRLIFNGTTDEKKLLLEEKKYLSPKMLEQLSLTRREAEILFWIARGKTDGEIAGLCGISPYTVQKHAQHIYIKLGVETRTAAMLRAMEVL